MKKILLTVVFILIVSTSSFAQWGDLINKVKSSPLMAQQTSVKEIINKVQMIQSVFSKMPMNGGKLEFVKAALPMLLQAKSTSGDFLSTIQKGQVPDPAQSSTINNLLGGVKDLVMKKWSTNPIAPAQIPEATKQITQVGSLLSGILGNEGSALKGLIQMAMPK